MAVAPLFVADVATLKSKLRLSGLSTGGDAEAILDNAIKETRENFVRSLGHTRILALQAFASVDNPTTDNETLRSLAETTEVKWTQTILLCTLTSIHLDGSGAALEFFNEEAPYRWTGPFERDKKVKSLLAEIANNLGLLSGAESFTSEVKGHATTFERATTAPRPGETVYTYLDD